MRSSSKVAPSAHKTRVNKKLEQIWTASRSFHPIRSLQFLWPHELCHSLSSDSNQNGDYRPVWKTFGAGQREMNHFRRFRPLANPAILLISILLILLPQIAQREVKITSKRLLLEFLSCYRSSGWSPTSRKAITRKNFDLRFSKTRRIFFLTKLALNSR